MSVYTDELDEEEALQDLGYGIYTPPPPEPEPEPVYEEPAPSDINRVYDQFADMYANEPASEMADWYANYYEPPPEPQIDYSGGPEVREEIDQSPAFEGLDLSGPFDTPHVDYGPLEEDEEEDYDPAELERFLGGVNAGFGIIGKTREALQDIDRQRADEQAADYYASQMGAIGPGRDPYAGQRIEEQVAQYPSFMQDAVRRNLTAPDYGFEEQIGTILPDPLLRQAAGPETPTRAALPYIESGLRFGGRQAGGFVGETLAPPLIFGAGPKETLADIGEGIGGALAPQSEAELFGELLPGFGAVPGTFSLARRLAPDLADVARVARAGAGGLVREAVTPSPRVLRVGAFPEALADLPPNSLAASLGSKTVADPRGVRILGPDEFVLPGEVEMFHGTARPLTELAPGSFVTPNPQQAASYARSASVLETQPEGALRRAFTRGETGALGDPASLRAIEGEGIGHAAAPPPRQPPAPPGGTGSEGSEFAANIRLSKYPEDIRATVKTWADNNPDLVQAARRGVRSDAEVLADARALVDEVGGDFNRLQRRWKPGDAWNAEEVTAIRGVLREQTEQVTAAAAAIRAGDDSSAAYTRLMQAMQEQARTQEIVHSVTAESGRALRAFRQEAFEASRAGDARRLDELLRRVGGRAKVEEVTEAITKLDLENPYQVNQFLRDVNKPGLWDYVREVYMNSILSGPKTHIVNSLSNTVNALMSSPERLAAAGVEQVLARAQGRAVARFWDEAPADFFGAIEGLGEGTRGALSTMIHGITPSQASKWEFRQTAIRGPLGRVVRAPGTMLEAADTFFHAVNYRAALNASILRQARKEGLHGDALFNRIAELKANPTTDLIKQAGDVAEYRLFRSPPGTITSAIMNARDKIPGAYFVLPFLRTPGNLIKLGMERSPAAFLDFGKAGVWRNLAAKSPEASDQIGRAMVGSAVGATLALYYAKGQITGAPPSDAAERDRFYREGKLPFAIKIGGVWIQYQRMEPYNQVLTQISAASDAIKAKDKSVDQKVSGAISTLIRNLADQTYLTGLRDVLEAMEDPEGFQAAALLRRQASSLVPYSSLLRTGAQITDPTVRWPVNIFESIQANIPGLSQNVPPRLTAFGEEVERQSPAWSPIQVTREQQTIVDGELDRLGMDVGFVGRSIAGIGLDREQQALYQRAAGQRTYQVLDALVNSGAYKALSDGDKLKVIDRAILASRDTVRDPLAKLKDSDGWGQLTAEQRAQVINAVLDQANEILREQPVQAPMPPGGRATLEGGGEASVIGVKFMLDAKGPYVLMSDGTKRRFPEGTAEDDPAVDALFRGPDPYSLGPRSPEIQMRDAQEAGARIGLPPELFNLATGLVGTDEYIGVYRAGQRAGESTVGQIGLDPFRQTRSALAPGQYSPADTALHESLHSFEFLLTNAERQELIGLMVQNPPPLGGPTTHHPNTGDPRNPVTGVTSYFDYWFEPGHLQGPELAGTRIAPPTAVLDFIRRFTPIVAQRAATMQGRQLVGVTP